MEEQNFEGELTFNNNDYLVSVRTIQVSTFDPGSQKLYIEVEEKLTGNIWKGDFQAKYIEDITTKAGVAKKFGIFVKMLIQALKSSTDSSVCIDLLTYADLENLKNKRNNNTNNPQNQNNNNKRYFILTYITEFERVHYPLSLNYVEEPEADQLRRTIERMRNMILMQKSNAFSIQSQEPLITQKNHMNQTQQQFSSYSSQKNNKVDDFVMIEEENEGLRRQINEMEAQFKQSHSEFYSLTQQKFYTESEYDKYKRDAHNQIMALQEQVRNAEQELAQLQDQIKQNPSNRVTQTSGFSLSSGQVSGINSVSDVDHVKRQLDEINSQLEHEKSTTGVVVARQEEEIAECRRELEEQRENEKKLRARQKELQEELDHTLRRIEQLQRGGGASTPIRSRQPYGYSGTGGSRNASPYSRNSSGSKKVGTPGSNNNTKTTGTRPGGVIGGSGISNLYIRQNRNPSNGRGTNGTTNNQNATVQRQSPQRFGQNSYKPPNQIRQNSNNRQSPSTTGLRIGAANTTGSQKFGYQRNASSNNRSGSNNNRTGVNTGYNRQPTGNSNYSKPGIQKQSQIKPSGSNLTQIKSSTIQQDSQQTTQNKSDNYDSLNINIMTSSNNQNGSSQLKDNKENMIKQPIQSTAIQDNSNNYDDVDVKDINSKLSRLQDLLKLAKQN